MAHSSWRKMQARLSQPARRRGRRPSTHQYFSPYLETLEDRRLLAACSVSNGGDSGAGTLRQCIQNLGSPINIPAGLVIRILTNLPRVDYPVTISGPAIDPPQAFLEPAINSFATMGLWINGGGSRIIGLAIGGFSGSGMEAGLLLSNNGNNGRDTVQDCYLGYGGDQGFASPLPNDVGLMVASDSPNDLIGGTMTGAPVGNVIANNFGPGMIVQSANNQILGNFIGTDENNTAGLGNSDGIDVQGDLNTIGGTVALERNLISGNFGVGLNLMAATRNLIEGNYIGTKQNGTEALPNMGVGINVASNLTASTCAMDPVGNIIGGTLGMASQNVISGNGGGGVVLSLSDCDVVKGNEIGLDFTGSNALPNTHFGVSISAGSFNTIGGAADGDRNIISANLAGGSGTDGDGVQVSGSQNVVLNNYIGTDRTGTSTFTNVGNAGSGVVVSNGMANLIGGQVADPRNPRNVISGNLQSGVKVLAGAMGTMIQGNFIGTDVSGTQPLGNASTLSTGLLLNAGVSISGGAQFTCVGGTFTMANNVSACLGGTFLAGMVSEYRNVISANQGPPGDPLNDLAPGVSITGFDSDSSNTTSNNLVAGNFIGTDWSGTFTSYRPDPLTPPVSLGNGRGVYIWGRATNNMVGDPTPRLTPGPTVYGNRNIISGNLYDGVAISDRGTTGNALYDNYIGTNVGGTLLGNLFDMNGVRYGNGEGVDVFDAATGNHIGGYIQPYQGASENPPDTNRNSADVFDHGNLIAGNLREGVRIYDSNTSLNLVQGNLIGNYCVQGNVGSYCDPNNTNQIDTPLVNRQPNGQFIGQTIGVALAGFSSTNDVGGTVMDMIGGQTYIIPAGNIISGNTIYGVAFHDSRTFNNLVDGNMIGPDLTGTRAVMFRDVPNNVEYKVQPYGAAFYGGAGNAIFQLGNTLGGTTAQTRNVITGNINDGVLIFGTPDPLDDEALPQYNVVLGNYIGTDIGGTTILKNPYHLNDPPSIGNGGNGINIYYSAHDNTIGGTLLGMQNLITGNPLDGVLIDSEAHNNVIEGNIIGLNARGLRFLNGPGNGLNGIEINLGHNDPLPPHDNVIGRLHLEDTPPVGVGNVISANTLDGILIAGGSTNNSIQFNDIGTDIAGNLRFGRTDLGNGTTPDVNGFYYNGIDIVGAGTNQTTIGGLLVDVGNMTLNPGNTIGFNGNDGILIDTGILNTILSNNIGLDQDLNDPGAAADPGINLINGANDMVAHPDTSWITSASYSTSTNLLTFTGFASGLMPNTTYILDFFLNADANRPASGLGEGEMFVGGIFLVTDMNGAAVIDPNDPVNPATFVIPNLDTNYYQWVTMTLTYPNPDPNADPNPLDLAHWGDTSDFSDNMAPPSTDNVPLNVTPVPGKQHKGWGPNQTVTAIPVKGQGAALGTALASLVGASAQAISIDFALPAVVEPAGQTPASVADLLFARIGRGLDAVAHAASESHRGHHAEGMALGDLFRERIPDLFEGF